MLDGMSPGKYDPGECGPAGKTGRTAISLKGKTTEMVFLRILATPCYRWPHSYQHDTVTGGNYLTEAISSTLDTACYLMQHLANYTTMELSATAVHLPTSHHVSTLLRLAKIPTPADSFILVLYKTLEFLALLFPTPKCSVEPQSKGIYHFTFNL